MKRKEAFSFKGARVVDMRQTPALLERDERKAASKKVSDLFTYFW